MTDYTTHVKVNGAFVGVEDAEVFKVDTLCIVKFGMN